MQAPKTGGAITLKGGTSLIARIKQIEVQVNTELGKYANDYLILRDEEEIKEYIYGCCNTEWTALDFETSGLNPLRDVIAGTVLYCDGQKPAYIPQNHISYISNQRYDHQAEDAFVKEQLLRLNASKSKIEYDNAKFDYRIGKHYLGVEMRIDWDTDPAAHLLDENLMQSDYALKRLYSRYVDPSDTTSFTYSELFDSLPFTMIPIKVGYLYAAGDGPKTDKLRVFQQKHLNADVLPGVFNVYMNVELPLIEVTARMEDTGIALRDEYQEKLSAKYHGLLDEAEAEYKSEVEKVLPSVVEYCRRNQNTESASVLRSGEISHNSPKKLAALLYDVLRVPVVDKRSPRGTGADILAQIDHPICSKIVKMRTITKLLGTYIDKMPNEVDPDTGMIHANFHQNGTVTGRYSSSDPKAYWGAA